MTFCYKLIRVVVLTCALCWSGSDSSPVIGGVAAPDMVSLCAGHWVIQVSAAKLKWHQFCQSVAKTPSLKVVQIFSSGFDYIVSHMVVIFVKEAYTCVRMHEMLVLYHSTGHVYIWVSAALHNVTSLTRHWMYLLSGKW